MKILQVSHNYHVVGGSDAMFFATCDLLKSAGHSVIPFCIDSPKNLPTRWSSFFPKGINPRQVTPKSAVRYFYNSDAKAKLNKLLDHVGHIDAAHIHIYHGKHTPAILSVLRRRGIPVIQTLHEYKLACPVYTLQRHGKPCNRCVGGSNLNCLRYRCKDRSFLKSLVMLAEKSTSRMLGDVRLVDRFLCVSDFQKKIMKDAGLPAERLHTLHNFVSTDIQPKQEHDGYYLYFGRLEELKGISTLVEAFKRCRRQLVIAGDGELRTELQLSINSVGNIKYMGFQSGAKLQNLIRQSKAVVVPSQWYENCPMSVLEAKACGRPVIGAKIGGIPELVRDQVDGFLFEPGNQDDLISAIGAMETANYDALEAAAISDAESRFSADAHLNTLMDHYCKAIESTSIPEKISA